MTPEPKPEPKRQPGPAPLRLVLGGDVMLGRGVGACIARHGPAYPLGAVAHLMRQADLAGPALARVKAPTLLIVGERDHPVIAMNRDALAQLESEKRLDIVPGATHLFEEPGTLEQVARLAAAWFERHLRPAPRA